MSIPATRTRVGGKCNCCPYGCHIEVDFVRYAENVANGSQRATAAKVDYPPPPTRFRTRYPPSASVDGGVEPFSERSLMSPLDSIFSDSLENIMSDFEEAYKPGDRRLPAPVAAASHNRRPPVGTNLTNGYQSDGGARYRKPEFSFFDSKKPPTGRQRALSTAAASLPPEATPTSPPVFNTALARTMMELRTKQAERRSAEEKSESSSPRMPRRGFGLPTTNGGTIPYRGIQRQRSEHQWNKTVPASVARSRSAIDVDTFASVCRKRANNMFSDSEIEPMDNSAAFNRSVGSTTNGMHEELVTRPGSAIDFSRTPYSSRSIYATKSPVLQRANLEFRTYSPSPSPTAPTPTAGFARSYSSLSRPTHLQSVNGTLNNDLAKTEKPEPKPHNCLECNGLKGKVDELMKRLEEVYAIKDALPQPKSADCFRENSNSPLPPPEKRTIGFNVNYPPPKIPSRNVSTSTGNLAAETRDSSVETEAPEVPEAPKLIHASTNTEAVVVAQTSTNATLTSWHEFVLDCSTQTESVKISTVSTETESTSYATVAVETEEEVKEVPEVKETNDSMMETERLQTNENGCQTEVEEDNQEPRTLTDSEIADSLWLIPQSNLSDNRSCDLCSVCSQSLMTIPGEEKAQEPEQVVPDHVIPELTRKDSDENTTTLDDTSEVESDQTEEPADLLKIESESDGESTPAPESLDLKRCDPAVSDAVKKLLTDQPQVTSFVRGHTTSKSFRVERVRGDDLSYIADQHKTVTDPTAGPSTPIGKPREALRGKVELKKEITPPTSRVPDPVPAKIPRPKISRYTPPVEHGETPDELEEAADRLTPLRSEMRSLHSAYRSNSLPRERHVIIEDNDDDNSSTSSSDSEGSYDTTELNNEADFELTTPLREALTTLNLHLTNPIEEISDTTDWAIKYIQHEWLKTAARRTAGANQVEGFLDALEEFPPEMMSTIVNMTDQNENTALHYAVSHGNFGVVGVLLDCRKCNIDSTNKAGYSALMLAALSDLSDEHGVVSAVVQRLFQHGDVNKKAEQHGQTALMLAASHGNVEGTKLLLSAGADVNIQDEEGSTALMCAAEHGHTEVVRLLLKHSDIDASIADCDSSTALSIAVENRHREIGMLLYAHLNHARKERGSPIR
ncbi:hypothetical protein L596_001531 [Steinernema carpocapsae]|uniref:Uncharacterized protein n=1 Tax=Steinernema carpocapsae TaxID=34508 RepID=A0A4U8ULB8_STECR|nr:hypothetical protein L596_001531 [Steinernema carpocapsae]